MINLEMLNTQVQRALDTQPSLLRTLEPLAGKVVVLNLIGTPVCLSATIEVEGLMLAQADADTLADATIEGSPLALLAAAQPGEGKIHPLARHVKISGDMEIALVVRSILQQANIDFESILAEFVGDGPADILSRGFGIAAKIGQRISRSLLDNTAAYLKDEAQLTPDPIEFEDFSDAVSKLRDGVARLEVRLDRLDVKQSG